MKSTTMRSLVICAFGAAMMAGCASSPRSISVASAQSNARSGKVAAVDRTVIVDQSSIDSSSGSSAVVTQARSGSDLITVDFNNGDRKYYLIQEAAAPLAVGQPVSVVPNGDNVTIMSP